MSFNPNATQTLGLEWPVTLTGLNGIDAISKGQVERFDSAVTETIDKVDVYLKEIGNPGLYGVEVYEAEDFIPSNQHTERSTPRTSTGQNTQNETGDFPWVDSDDLAVGFADLSQVIVEEDNTPDWDDTKYVTNAVNAEPFAHLAFRGGTGFADFDGLRVLRVDMWMRCKSAGGLAMANPTIENDAGTDLLFASPRAVPIGPNFSNVRLARMDASPLTGRPWTAAEATDYFSDTSTMRWGLRMQLNTVETAVQISALWADIVVADENRAALGTLVISQDDGWKSFTMTKPDGADNWAKVSGTSYDVLLHRLTPAESRTDLADGSLTWPYLSAYNRFCPHVGHRTITAVLNGAYGTGASYGAELTRAHPVRFVRSDAADSSDSQPYASLTAADIYTGIVARSQFNGAAAAGYGFVQFVLRPAIGAPSDLADITIKVKKQSDNSQLGGTVTLSKMQVDNFPDIGSGDGWKLAYAQIATATLATGTGYYIEFASTAGGVEPTRRWQVAFLSAAGFGSATYGGTGQSLEIAGFGEFTDQDMVATISVPPATPSGWSTVVVTP